MDKFLKNSKFLKWVLFLYKTWQNKVVCYSKTSTIIRMIREVEKELYFSTFKTSSIIILTATLTNIFFSLVLCKRIGFLGWSLRGVFLFIGLAGLSSDATWRDIKKTSYFLNKIKF